MKDDQILRGAGILVATVAYIARLVTIGNGTVDVLGYAANPFALFLVAVVVLALPEVVDKFPLGPTRE
jgi:hypothetical protein